MRVPDPVPAPDPAARVFGRRGSLVLIEARKIHTPDVAVLGGQRPAICPSQPFHSRPGKRQLNRPTAVCVPTLVESAIHVDCSLQSRKVPRPGAQAASARMCFETDSVERPDFWIGAGKLRDTGEATLFVALFPNEEHFVDGVEGIDFELIVAVLAGDKSSTSLFL